jgi:hypothetical protein
MCLTPVKAKDVRRQKSSIRIAILSNFNFEFENFRSLLSHPTAHDTRHGDGLRAVWGGGTAGQQAEEVLNVSPSLCVRARQDLRDRPWCGPHPKPGLS